MGMCAECRSFVFPLLLTGIQTCRFVSALGCFVFFMKVLIRYCKVLDQDTKESLNVLNKTLNVIFFNPLTPPAHPVHTYCAKFQAWQFLQSYIGPTCTNESTVCMCHANGISMGAGNHFSRYHFAQDADDSDH